MSDIQVNDYKERIKELGTINKTVTLIKEGRSINETLSIICSYLPAGWQYPEVTSARIIYNDTIWSSDNFIETTPWFQKQEFACIDRKKGSVEVYYNNQMPDEYEGPFLEEESNLLNNITNIITGYLNGKAGAGIINSESTVDNPDGDDTNMYILHDYLKKINADKDIYHDLMPYKVKEILLIATLFDVISLDLDGTSSLDIFEDYHQKYNSIIPRITGVSNINEAMAIMGKKNFDMVIIMPGLDMTNAIETCGKLKTKYSFMPVYLLFNNKDGIKLPKEKQYLNLFDSYFEWQGNSNIFYSIVKLTEDRVNIENDTKVGLVNVILLADSTPENYSLLLPLIYDNLLDKLKNLALKNRSTDIEMLLRLASRPKVIIARDYEEAKYYYNKYSENLLCFISNANLKTTGQDYKTRGLDLVREIRSGDKNLPVLIYSDDIQYQEKALDLMSIFVSQQSNSFSDDIPSFIVHQLDINRHFRSTQSSDTGFSHDKTKGFIEIIKNLSDEKFMFHAVRNHFSLWFRNRGLFSLAHQIQKLKSENYSQVADFREAIISAVKSNIVIHENGNIVPFDTKALVNPLNIVRLSDGILGGKGKGLAFLNSMLNTLNLNNYSDVINIEIPVTSVIGSYEFDLFIQRNNISSKNLNKLTDGEIRKIFAEGRLSDKVSAMLKAITSEIQKPLAVRSSGSLEDSINTPFSGIFDTYMLPNNHCNHDTRFQQLSTAVKLVYASLFAETARNYMEAVNTIDGNQKMGVVIQEVAGNRYEDYFYPHISGVAQSYNYYPVAHMKPEEGFASLAVGLGTYVVEGEKTFRFAPSAPEIVVTSTEDQIRDTQTMFYAIDMSNDIPDLLMGNEASLKKLDISVAEKHKTLNHLVSVYRHDNQAIVPGIRHAGPRIVNFANILKYNHIPLSEIINKLLRITEESLGCPCEIEFAVTLGKNGAPATFYLLQVVPLTGNTHNYNLVVDDLDKDKLFLFAEKGMGNGEIDDIDTIVYLQPINFNKLKTHEMAQEIGNINKEMIRNNTKYLLIGPGRWGTRDQFIGIPVNWPQISNAKVIVEYSMKDFPLDASLGSHFFHNVTSNDIGYLSVGDEQSSFINWEMLRNCGESSSGNYFNTILLKEPVKVRIDGKKRIAAITL